METIFRERVTEEPVTPVIQEVPEEKGAPLDPNVAGLKDVGDTIDSLAIWESEKGKRFIDEVFNTHITGSEFLIKMPTSEIDKYIRGELDERGFEKTTKNYREILQDIERQIGSDKLSLMKRFTKITGYIRIINKIKKARELQKKYLFNDN